jgi:DNA-binding transcriptional MerR regulator
MSLTYPIRAVAGKSGLSAHTIRAWEKRYGVLAPDRSDTNRRMYKEADIERLVLLRRAVAAGHSIGLIAGLSDEELRHLAGSSGSKDPEPVSTSDYLSQCRTAMLELDAEGFEAALGRGSAVLGIDGLLAEVVVPLLAELDRGWPAGTISISHEHLASVAFRTQLDRIRHSLQAPPNAPRLLVTTPSGQVHEMGALLVAISAGRDNWHVTYLGPNLPAEDIAQSARRTGAQAIALSIVHPAEDASLSVELRRLRATIGNNIPILVGGRAAEAYREVLSEVGATMGQDFGSMREALSALRTACGPRGG